MEILIAGDLVPTIKNYDHFNDCKVKQLIGEDLQKFWNKADHRVFNLEAPITDNDTPINKKGPNLRAPTSTLSGIKGLNPTLITLANNHILDHGKVGLESTINNLKKENIPYIGAGDNLFEASKPYIVTSNNKRIGFYTCAENEFTIAKEKSPGANPFDPLESLDHIASLKEQCDYLIVLYHGGKEHYRYPSPYLQKVTRKIVEKGADLVVCQHSHCIGCFEEYLNSTIIYGQGNFIFNKHNNEFWNNSILVKVILNDEVKIKYIPIVRTDVGIRLANEDESKKLLKGFLKRSEEIIKEDFGEKKYREFSMNSVDHYLRSFLKWGKWLSRLDRWIFRGSLLKMKYNEEYLLSIQNYIECEAHRELLLEGVKKLTENKQ